MKKYNSIIHITIISLLIFIPNSSLIYAKINNPVKVESATNPELLGKSISTLSPVSSVQSLNTSLIQPEIIGPNLILNPTLAISGPANWKKGGYGSNTRIFTYPINGNVDSKAVKVSISNYISGDAKWFFDNISVSPNTTYIFSDYSLSNTQSIITVRYTLLDGTFIYKDIGIIQPTSVYTKNTIRFITPAKAVSVTVFHLIKSNGFLSTDDYSINLVTPIVSNNLVLNGDFEVIGIDGLPVGWIRGGWGINTRTFSYPVTGISNSTNASVNITSYTTGDAKWYFKPIPISPGIYTYSDQVISNAPSTVTAQFNNTDGTITYKDLLKVPVATEMTASSVDFSVGSDVSSITIFHLIQAKAKLDIDNVSIIKKSDPVGIFKTGAITLRFDDAWLSQLENAIPKINSVGFKGTFYIVSRQKADDGYPAFMSTAQIKETYAMGHEIGAHTKTHPFLTTLSIADEQNEITGSRNDLLAMNVGPILSFAYPYGDYDNNTLPIVKAAGFTSAVSTIDGFGTQTSDKFQIERKGVTVDTTLSTMKQWVDDAKANKKWLVITFHEVNDSGSLYSISPQIFYDLIDYIVAKNIPVVTTTEGSQSVQ